MKLFAVNKIDSHTIKNLQSVLKTMDSKTTKEMYPNGCAQKISFVTVGTLKENGNSLIGSCPMLRGGKDLLEEPSMICIKNKTYVIDNLTGSVRPQRRSPKDLIFGITKKTLKNISDTINKIKENFDNTEIVDQYRWGLIAVTEKGAKIIREAQIKAFGHPL